MERVYDAAILGAGLAGSAMARALAARGWTTVALDRHPFPRHKVCGEFLSPEALRILAALDLSETVESLRPRRMDKVRLTPAGGETLEIPLPGPALGISRYALDAALQRAAEEQGADVRTGVTVTAVRRGAQGYEVETRSAQRRTSFAARTVIGAWGRHPRVGMLGGGAVARSRYVGVKIHLDGARPQLEPAVELYFVPGGYWGVAPIEENRLNAAALLGIEAFRQAGGTVRGALEAGCLANPALRRRLAGAEPVPGTQAAVALARTGRRPAAWGDFPLVGDAAAVIPPLCGDGMAMALRSVERCAPLADRHLRGELPLAAWRREYERSLRRECAGPIRSGRLLQSLLGNSALSSALLRLGLRCPALAFRFVQATRLKI